MLTDVRFTLSAGERLALLGSSGAGKSTLLLALLGLLSYRGGWARGEIHVAGQNLLSMSKRESRRLRGREISLVPQSPLSALNPALSLVKHFQAAWTAHRDADKAAFLARVQELMGKVGLPSDAAFLNRKPGQISVGQAQRCTLALALLHRPSLLIADEPTSALDPVNQAEVLALLRQCCEEDGASLVFVSHDLLSAFRLCSTFAVLSGGRLLPPLHIADLVKSTHPELRGILQALPIPADVLLQHTAGVSTASTKVPQADTLLTLSV